MAKQQQDQQSHSKRLVNDVEARVKALDFGINTSMHRIQLWEVDKVRTSPSKVRIRTMVRYLNVLS